MTTLLTLSETEKRQLTAYYIETVKDDFLQKYPEPDEDEIYWSSLQIGQRMFDLCVDWQDDRIVCIVYECHKQHPGDGWDNYWQTSLNKDWLLTEQEWV